MKADLLYDSKCILAESPLWHEKLQCFFWVDIEKGTLYQFRTKEEEVKTWTFPHRLTMVVEGANDQLILALDEKLARFDLQTGNLEWLIDIEKGLPDNRCNDGACDAKGRLWVGTMSTLFTEGAGALYMVDNNLSLQQKLFPVSISNGISWSLDHKTMYYIDSPTRKIQAFRFELSTGNIEFHRNVVNIPEEMGVPDGMCTDEKGMLWVAHYGGFGVHQWHPETGLLLDKIDVAAPNVTSCAFGGQNGNQLLITTARENLDQELLERYPESGSVFIAKMKVKGARVYNCGF
ncbi:MAG: SMP-30/gluconolactonase/LRE family protein [Cyclobacteriaceae bacterium]